MDSAQARKNNACGRSNTAHSSRARPLKLAQSGRRGHRAHSHNQRMREAAQRELREFRAMLAAEGTRRPKRPPDSARRKQLKKMRRKERERERRRNDNSERVNHATAHGYARDRNAPTAEDHGGGGTGRGAGEPEDRFGPELEGTSHGLVVSQEARSEVRREYKNRLRVCMGNRPLRGLCGWDPHMPSLPVLVATAEKLLLQRPNSNNYTNYAAPEPTPAPEAVLGGFVPKAPPRPPLRMASSGNNAGAMARATGP